MPERKADRLNRANLLIDTIKSTGRKFFSAKNGVDAKLIIAENGHIYIICDHNGERAIVRKDWIRSRHFHHGGTLNHFIRCLAYWIRSGEPIPVQIFSDHWGYGDEIKTVIGRALDLEICAP